MAERSAYLAGANLALVILVSFLWLALGLLFLGPGRATLGSADQELQRRSARQSEWQRRHGSAPAISREERAGWVARYAQVRDFGAPPGDEAALTAWVASRLAAPSVRGLQVTRTPANGETEFREALELGDPFGDGSVRLVPVPIHVRFDAGYRDVARILARLEPEASALKIRELSLRRQFPGVRVELDGELWTREERGA